MDDIESFKVQDDTGLNVSTPQTSPPPSIGWVELELKFGSFTFKCAGYKEVESMAGLGVEAYRQMLELTKKEQVCLKPKQEGLGCG